MEKNIARKRLYGAMLVALGMTALPVGADVFIVNSVLDAGDDNAGDGICDAGSSGSCTLRAAVEEANAHTGPDTITLKNDTYVLRNGTLTVSGELIIRGTAPDNSIISGDHRVRIFKVMAGAKLTLEHLTLTQGGVADGGVLYNENGGKVTMENVKVTDGSSDQGRAIVNESGAMLTIQNSLLQGDHSNKAGILNRGGDLTITDSTLENYRADNSDPNAPPEKTSGAAIASGEDSGTATGTVTIQRTEFRNNHASAYGGAVAIAGPSTIEGSTFSNNSAGGDGGALAVAGRTDTDTTSEARITGSTFTGNQAGARGGALFTATTTSIEGSVLESNGADLRGGAIYQLFVKERNPDDAPPLTIGKTAIRNNQITALPNNSDGYGGGLYAGDRVTVTQSEISGNRANKGGGIYVAGQRNHVSNSTISGNTAMQNGGGLYMQLVRNPLDTSGDSAARVTLTHVTLVKNAANNNDKAELSGDNIWFSPGSKATIYNSIVALATNGHNCTRGTSSGPQPVTSVGTALAAAEGNFTEGTCGPGTITGNLGLDETLRDNGGPTHTHALLPGSNAIDALTNTHCEKKDQRDKPRDDNCDVGAFERQADDPTNPGGSGNGGSGSGNGSGNSNTGGNGGTAVKGAGDDKSGPAKTGTGPLGPWMLLLGALLGWRRLRR